MTRPDLLEPFAAGLSFTGAMEEGEALVTVARLLEDIAEGCERAGSSLIGHIKCHVETGGRSFHCNLTSRRSGARCAGAATSPSPVGGAETEAPSNPGRVPRLEMDLAVLVYGLRRAAVEEVVRGALAGLPGPVEAGPPGGEWSLHVPDHSRDTPHSPHTAH